LGEGLLAERDPSSGADFIRATFSHKGRREEAQQLPWRHADGAVETDGFAVEHRVLHDVHREVTVFAGIAEPRRMRHLAPKLLRASSFNPINNGVRNKPGAIVLTRILRLARSRAAGSVRPTTPPFEAE